MAVYLKIAEVPGECSDEDHPKWIECESFSLGVQNPISMGSGQGSTATGTASFEPFMATKIMDSSSPLLNAFCAAGKIFDDVEIHLTMSLNEEQAVYQKYIFKKAAISYVGVNGGDTKPMETFSMAYSEVEWTFTPYDHKGVKQADVVKSHSLETNKGA